MNETKLYHVVILKLNQHYNYYKWRLQFAYNDAANASYSFNQT